MTRKFNIKIPFLLWNLFFFLYAGNIRAMEAQVLVLPHVEANEDFFTGLSFLNTAQAPCEARLTAYSEDGALIGEKDGIKLSPGERYLNSVADIFGYKLAPEVSWIKIEHTGGLIGFGLMVNDSQLARIPLQSKGKKTIILQYVISDEEVFTQVYVLNVGEDFSRIKLSAYDGDGALLKSVDFSLAPGQKTSGLVGDFFGPEVSAEVSWIKAESDGMLMGIGLVGSTDGLFSIPME